MIDQAISPSNTLRLKDGRRLGYAEYGDPTGKLAFFFHGMPGSRLEARFADEIARKHALRLIAVDRPGYGLSDFQRGRSFLDWPDDVVELADALGIERFAVGGVSGGGPYVAACAYKIPQRLTAAGIVSGVGPFEAPEATQGMSRQNRLLFGLARRFPWAVPVPLWLAAQGLRRFPKRAASFIERSFPEPDRKVLQSHPEVLDMLLRDAAEAYRPGVRGAAWESIMYARPWGFRLEDISMPVYLWQGEADANVPVSMGHYQAHAIPNCHATFYAGEGHLLCIDRMPEILAALLT